MLPAEPDLAGHRASHGVITIMNGIGRQSLGYCAGVLGLVALGWILTGQAARPSHQGQPMDWTHRHVIFSQPSTDAQAAAVMHDPRYWQQFNRQHFVRTLNVGQADLNSGLFANAPGSQGAWSENLGSGANAGAGVYPAKYSFSVTTANCGGTAARPDTVVFSTGLAGKATQANIVAFDNLYAGCGGTVPQVYWAYNTGIGTGWQILTSPISSEDGTQVAFVQRSGGVAYLVLLKWAPGGTISSPIAPVNITNLSLYRGCTAPCMTQIELMTGGSLVTAMDDTTSSVFPVYGLDVIWVGGEFGWLNKFTGVFKGTPARVTTGGFPVQVPVGGNLFTSSPVYDFASNSVFISDTGGFLDRVSSTGAVTTSGQLDFGIGGSATVIASPVVDSTSGKVYVFASSDGTNAAVYQLPTNFAAGSTGTKITVGVSSASPNPMFAGEFDSSYFGSGTATGNLYVCGNTGGAPTLYRIPINAGTMAAAVAGPVLSSSTTTGCSPVTDVPNPNVTGGATEWIFASAQASGLGNSCGGGGCAMNFLNTPWLPSHAYTVGQQVLDSRFNVETCRVAGTSRTAAQGPPAWNAAVGGSTTDGTGTLRWINQGPQAAAHGAWQASHAYVVGNSIIDSNGNVQVVTTAGTSKTGTHPTWQTTIYAPNTFDGSVRWRNGGLPATSSLATAGGTGGIIVDNVVGSTTLGGASQIYFSTQSNQSCITSGTTGGCAMQASQAALK